MKRTSIALLGLLVLNVPAHADEHGSHENDHGDNGRAIAMEHAAEDELPQVFIEARRDALIGHASTLPGYEQISGVTIEDMNGDRRLEAIVVSGETCETDYGCAWTAFSDMPDGWQAIGKGYAQAVSFLKPAGSDNFVIDTDGVQWVYRGGKEIALSTGGLARKRPLRPTEADYAFLAEAKPEFDDRAEMNLVRYEIDIDMDGKPETVLVIRGLKYGLGTSGMPYLILDPDQNILVDSAAPDLPVIFPQEGAGLIVNPTPSGFQILEVR